MSKNVTGTIREKKGLYYAVINYYGENEERKQKWFPTKLPVRGNKKKAEAWGGVIGDLISFFGGISSKDMQKALDNLSQANLIKDSGEGIKVIKKFF